MNSGTIKISRKEQGVSDLFEALEYKDMQGMLKPTLHVDEFAAKMGDDDEIIVLSFFVRSAQAARDLENWFEKGYDWVMDADTSPGEIRPGRYLVYVEMRRRSRVPQQIQTMLEDLGTLTEFQPDQWHMHYGDQTLPFTEQDFARVVPLSPKSYRKARETDLNEMRVAAGLNPRPIYEVDRDLRQLQSAAGIY